MMLMLILILIVIVIVMNDSGPIGEERKRMGSDVLASVLVLEQHSDRARRSSIHRLATA